MGSNDNYNQNNNVGASQHSGHNGEDGDMADADDDSMDDEDMMDKISSSPSIDDGQSPVHVRPEHWPLRSSSLLNLRDLQTALSSSPSLQDPGQANAAANRFATLFRNAPPGVSVRHARQTVASGSPLRLSSSPARMIPVVLPNTGPRWPLESSPAGSSTPHRTANNIINQEPGSNESGSSTNYWTIPIARQNFGPRWPIESSPGMAFPSPQHRDGRPNSTPSRDARWPLRESSLQLSSPGASVVPNNRPGFSIVRSPVLALSPPNDRRNWLLESSPERSSDDLPPMQGSPLRRVQHQRMDSSDESFTSNDGVPRAVPNTGDRWPIESSSPESERPIRSIANVLAHASQQSQQSQQGMPVLDGQRSATFGERPLPPIPTQQSLRARAHAVDRRPFMPTTFTRNAVLSSTATRPRQPSTAPGDNERYITESSVNGSTVLQEASRSTLSVDSQATERQRDIGEGSVNEEGESEFTEAAALVGSDAGTADGSLTEHSESGNAGFAPVLGYDADIDTSVDSSNQSISEAPSDASTGEPPVRTMGRSETIYFSPARTMSRSETVYFSPERGMPRSETLYFSPRQSVAISEISGASSPVLAPPTTMPGSWIDSPQHSPILPPERPSTPDSGSDTDFQSVRAKSPRRAITSVSETVLVTPTRSNRLSRPESQVSITSNFSRSGLITGNTTEPIARLVLPPLDANTTLRPPSTPPTPQFDDPHGNYHIINFAFLDSEPLMPEFVYELVMSAPKDRSKRESLLSVSSDLAGFYGVYEDFQRMAEEREKDLKEMEKEHAKLESDLEEQSDTESKESTILDIHSDLNPLCRNIRPKDDDESSDSGNEVQTTHGDDLNSEDYTDEVQTGEEDTFDESEVGSFTDDELDTSELALTRTPSRAVVQHSDECSTSELEENLKDSQESLASYESDPSYDDQYEEEPVDEYGNPLIAYDGYDSDDSSYSSSGQEDLDVDNVPPAYLAYGWAAECLQDPEDIDFEFVYALHTFVATVEGQANATKGDTMVLLDDSNSYWWLVRVVKDSSIGE